MRGNSPTVSCSETTLTIKGCHKANSHRPTVSFTFPSLLPCTPSNCSDLAEAFREGLPRYSTLLGRLTEFRIFRRFAKFRTRLLLLKQDQISGLESELNDLDHLEQETLFLGASRKDGNRRRQAKFRLLEAALAEYGVQDEVSGHVCLMSACTATRSFQTRLHMEKMERLKNWPRRIRKILLG